jgi:uncharacterized membrane protein
VSGEVPRAGRGALGPALLLVSVAGLLVAGYLAVERWIGEPPVCGPGGGCETVAASEYATLFGILPVAYLGFAFSVLLVGLALVWWLRAERWALVTAYGLLLLAVLFEAYLVYLELFVIKAICIWCAVYGVTIVLSLIAAGLALRRSSAAT